MLTYFIRFSRGTQMHGVSGQEPLHYTSHTLGFWLSSLMEKHWVSLLIPLGAVRYAVVHHSKAFLFVNILFNMCLELNPCLLWQIDLRQESTIKFSASSAYPVITFGPFNSPADVMTYLSHAIGNSTMFYKHLVALIYTHILHYISIDRHTCMLLLYWQVLALFLNNEAVYLCSNMNAIVIIGRIVFCLIHYWHWFETYKCYGRMWGHYHCRLYWHFLCSLFLPN